MALGATPPSTALHADEAPLGLDIALHCGDVFYGNIGAPGRLDFTVIGPAVNEVEPHGGPVRHASTAP